MALIIFNKIGGSINTSSETFHQNNVVTVEGIVFIHNTIDGPTVRVTDVQAMAELPQDGRPTLFSTDILGPVIVDDKFVHEQVVSDWSLSPEKLG